MTMASNDRQGDLFPGIPLTGQALIINDRCLVRTQDGHRVIIVAGIVHSQYTVGDQMAEAYAMVSLVEQGWADQKEVARVFDYSTRTVRRQQRRFESGGLAALGHGSGFPQGRHRLRGSRSELILRLKTEGHPNREIARRVGVSEKAIRKLLRRQGWRTQKPEQPFLLDTSPPGADPNLSAFSSMTGKPPMGEVVATADPNLSAFCEASEEKLPFSLDSDPANRSLDRILAFLGMLEDAAPLFRAGTRVRGASVLLALPALEQSGVFDCAREIYGSLGPAFYGLRTTILTLLLMALLRIKRPEGLKEQVPDNLGRVLGLDRAPEVKTLRRKLARLASTGRAAQFGRALAERRVALRGSAMGFLYVDGHVRVYHGKHKIPKAHVTRMRLAMPATSDYWVNDMSGDPLFVVTAPANAGLVKMLPTVLDEVRALVGERRVTVAFDRGGYSPKLFKILIAAGFDILTYRKGRTRPVPRARFKKHQATIDGRDVVYMLADQGVLLLKRKLRMRQVTRLSENGHQTPILTSRCDLPAVEVAFRMFERWRQENFFKYLREEYALDALVDYGVVPDTPTREVPNPARAVLEDKLREARAKLTQLQAEYGREALKNTERKRPTMRGFKIAKSKHGRAISSMSKHIASLEKARADLPRRLPVENVVSGEVVKLAPERKHLTNLLKMVAYQAEGDLVRLVAPHYRRVDEEGRTLIQCALAADADIEIEERVLRVVIAPLSSRHRTQAIAALCEELNRSVTIFPGSRLRLQFAVRANS